MLQPDDRASEGRPNDPGDSGTADSLSLTQERRRLGAPLRILLITLLLVVSLWYALSDVNWELLTEYILDAHFWWVLAAGLVTLASHVIRAERWRLLIPRGHEISLWDATSATVVGYMMNNVIPRSGEVIRPATLARRSDRSVSSLLATVMVERIFDGITLLIILLMIIGLASEEIARLVSEIPQLEGATPSDLMIQLALPVVAIIGLILLLFFTRFGERSVHWIARKFPDSLRFRIESIYSEFREGVRFTGGGGKLAGILLWTVPIWLGYGVSFWFSIIAFDLQVDPGLQFGDALVLLGVTSIGITIAPTPGGFGVFHTFCRIALISLYGIGLDRAVAFALVSHAAQYLVVMAAGAGFALREARTRPKG